MSAIIEVGPDLVREFTGGDVLCLHPICQPVVNEMQAVIRHQREQLVRAVAAMDYVVRVQGEKLLATEQFGRLTLAIAEIKGQDVHGLREQYLPGSANFYRRDDE